MSSIKEQIIEAIRTMPDDLDYDDVIEEMIYLSKVERGLRDAEEGRTISIDEAKKQFGVG